MAEPVYSEEYQPDRRLLPLITLIVLFVVSLTASNFLASKLFSVRIYRFTIVAPAAVAAYALTFTFTDIIGEVYGKKMANLAVRLGFISQLLVLAYIWIALKLPIWEHSPVSEETYRSVIYSSNAIIIASLTAYLVSQHHDVWAFHLWKRLTRGKWLWLRNNASTIVSQFLDTVIFITLAFHFLPAMMGGNPLPLRVISSIIIGQYIVKVLIALADTPLVYAGVFIINKYIAAIPKLQLMGAIDTGRPGRS